MCGRYMLDKDFDDLLNRYNVNVWDDSYRPSKEIFPSQNASIITKSCSIVLRNIKWGYKSYYGKKLIINGRSETLLEKKLFRNSYLKRRCIIPANGFLEWESVDNKKVKRSIKLPSDEIFSIGGIYRTFLDDEGSEYDAFTILTTQSSEKLSRVHNRMPVIINREDENLWLDNATDINVINNMCLTNKIDFKII